MCYGYKWYVDYLPEFMHSIYIQFFPDFVDVFRISVLLQVFSNCHKSQKKIHM